MQFKTKEFYFKNYYEMKQVFPYYDAAIHTTIEIANKFQVQNFIPSNGDVILLQLVLHEALGDPQ
jgi:DNA polymerase III alpha subunit